MKHILKFLTLATLTISLCSCDSRFKAASEIAFVIEPFCEKEVAEYFRVLNKLESFEARMIDTIESKSSLLPSIRSIGIIQASILEEDLSGYVNGAKENCGSDIRTTIELTSDPEILSFLLQDISNENFGKSVYIELNDNELQIHHYGTP